MTRLAMILTVLAITAAPARADCATTVWIWMFTARAQSACLFQHYDAELVVRSRRCGTTMTRDALETAMTDGSRHFDYTVSMLGKALACEDTLRAFSNVVQR